VTTTTTTAVEMLHFPGASDRTQRHLRYLKGAAELEGIDLVESQTYRGGSMWLLLWGPGDPPRAQIMRNHLAGGGRVLALDLAYWQRDTKIRVSIDAAHPQAWVMRRDWPSDRYTVDLPPRGEVWKPNGPAVIAGIGQKAKIQYGDDVAQWEQAMTERCLASGLSVHYRRKRGIGEPTRGAKLVPDSLPIDRVLAGASLAITWHSNVAVDALRLGLPVICQDGAAAAICPSSFGRWDPLPLELRDRFLRNLAYFQWGATTHEARRFWQWWREITA